MGLRRYCLFLSDDQIQGYRFHSDRVDLPAAELMRRLLDLGLREPTVLNQLVPDRSGCFVSGGTRLGR